MPDSSLTIRLSSRQREALRRKAAAMKMKESSWVRELIERDIGGEPLGKKLEGLRGAVASGSSRKGASHALATKIRERNWRQ
jgi:hypothetical protein